MAIFPGPVWWLSRGDFSMSSLAVITWRFFQVQSGGYHVGIQLVSLAELMSYLSLLLIALAEVLNRRRRTAGVPGEVPRGREQKYDT